MCAYTACPALYDSFLPAKFILRFMQSAPPPAFIWIVWSRDSSVGIAIRCGMKGPGIESRWGRDFPHPSRPALGSIQLPIQWVPGLSREKSGRGVALTTHPPSIAEVKERVELYIWSPSGTSWPILGKGKVHPCTGTEALYRPYSP